MVQNELMERLTQSHLHETFLQLLLSPIDLLQFDANRFAGRQEGDVVLEEEVRDLYAVIVQNSRPLMLYLLALHCRMMGICQKEKNTLAVGLTNWQSLAGTVMQKSHSSVEVNCLYSQKNIL